jgi:hypothetical protein
MFVAGEQEIGELNDLRPSAGLRVRETVGLLRTWTTCRLSRFTRHVPQKEISV